MAESCTTTPQTASPNEGNWARRITDEFNSVGFTIEGMPEHLSSEQAINMLESVQTQLAAHKAARA